MSQPLVSVYCLAYNHTEFIRQALESIISQRTRFAFEIIVHDDASTDGTADVIREYEAKYASLVFPILRTENLYSQGKKYLIHRDAFAKARGKYIAVLEGDDYWCDSRKLARQVESMESNPDIAICFCGTMVKIEATGEQYAAYVDRPEKRSQIPTPTEHTTILDLARGNYIHTPGVMFRKFDASLMALFSTFPVGDWPLYMLAAREGNILFDPEIMAVYRVHGQGVWNGRPQAEKSWIGCGLTCAMLDAIQWPPDVQDILIRGVFKTLRTQCGFRSEEEMRPYLQHVLNAASLSGDAIAALMKDLREARQANEALAQEMKTLENSGFMKVAAKWWRLRQRWGGGKSPTATPDEKKA